MDLRIYFVTADLPEIGRSHTDTAKAAAKGGATAIQFRDKTMDNMEFERTAREIKAIAEAYGIPLIVNDRVDIGAMIGADGVHAGQGDMDIKAIRGLVGSDVLIGYSVSDVGQALIAEAEGADYLGAGPIFSTGSKDDALPPIGPNELQRICGAVGIPVVGIGGITVENIDQISKSGAAGAAVIAAIAKAPDMERATAELLSKWETK